MKDGIKFGTSGWRGIISDDFTYSNVRLVSQAIANHLKKQKHKARVIVGYDTRFMSEDFARESTSVLAANGIKCLITKRDTPTPVIAYEIIRRKAQAGINITASHNPYCYNGLKFSPAWGGPALPEDTRDIERELSHIKKVNYIAFDEACKKGLITVIDPLPAYFAQLQKLIDFSAIKHARLKIAVDALWGTAHGILDVLLSKTGCRVFVRNNERDVLFGGTERPEPAEEFLDGLSALVRREKCQVGVACDPDADRFGIVDGNGKYILPNYVIALVLYHLAEHREWRGVVARSVMTSSLVDRVARKYGMPVRETPVGFKYIGEVMLKENLVLGGEESGGLTIHGHVPEKDGILAALLVVELIAREKKPLGTILQKIYRQVGPVYDRRINLRFQPEMMTKIRNGLNKKPPAEIGGFKVLSVNRLDGVKFLLEQNSWVGLRLSGTEPVVRCYIEAPSGNLLERLTRVVKPMIKNVAGQ